MTVDSDVVFWPNSTTRTCWTTAPTDTPQHIRPLVAEQQTNIMLYTIVRVVEFDFLLAGAVSLTSRSVLERLYRCVQRWTRSLPNELTGWKYSSPVSSSFQCCWLIVIRVFVVNPQTWQRRHQYRRWCCWHCCSRVAYVLNGRGLCSLCACAECRMQCAPLPLTTSSFIFCPWKGRYSM